MTIQKIDTTTDHGSYRGDPGKVAWDKANENFAELDAANKVARPIATGGTGATTVEGALAALGAMSSNRSSLRNHVINGDLSVWQAGTSFTGGGWTADQWNFDATSGLRVDQAVTGMDELPRGLRYWMAITANTSGYFRTKLEGVRRYSGRRMVFSFYAKSPAAGALLRNFGFRQNFGTGGSPSPIVDTLGNTTVIALSSGATRYNVTVDLPSIAGKALGTDGNDHLEIFCEHVAPGATIYFGGVQFEEGDAPTAFDVRPPALELELCQRYFETGSYFFVGYNQTGFNLGGWVQYHVRKRVTPTMVLLPFSYSNAAGAGSTNVTPDGFGFYATVSSSGGAQGYCNWTASARL